MLWNLIRDFFVQHVFGGIDSANNYHQVLIGYVLERDSQGVLQDEFNAGGTEMYFNIGSSYNNDNFSITLSDWLSTTATAISITIIVVLCCLFIYKIVRLIGGLIR